MDADIDWVSRTTRVGEAIRYRPASLEAFYNLPCDPWTDGGRTLEDVCGYREERIRDLVREIASLPVPAADSAWDSLPARCLIDYLTEDHRRMLRRDLPAFRRLLEMPWREAAGGHLLEEMRDTLDRFGRIFLGHVREEEESVFPAILKCEDGLAYGNRSAQADPFPARMRMAARLADLGNSLDFALDRWAFSMTAGIDLDLKPKLAGFVRPVMRRLENRIRGHVALEREHLYPAVFRIEGMLGAAMAG